MVKMAQVNLFPTFDKWTINNGSGSDVSDSLVISGDGYGCLFSVASEDSYLRLRIQDNDIIALRGRKLVLHLDNFSSSDNKPWLRMRAYSDTTNNIYESFNLYYEDDDVPGVLRNFPIDYEFVVPEDCVRLDIRFQHDYAAEGIDPPALLSISNASLTEYVEEEEEKDPEFINFHKVLEENLPASVTPGTQHIYFTAKDSEVRMHIATNEGTLISTPDVNDIRTTLAKVKEDVEHFLNVDEETVDELSEVLELIDANRGDLESLTTSKVSKSDIVDNLTSTGVSDKPLSAG
jgi:hypothetical protein